MYSGGIADKVGNRFEARWLIYQLMGLLDGTALAVTVEKVGSEDEGFEFEVERVGGSEWHQCKRQTSKSWTIRRLEDEGVIANFVARLSAGLYGRCIFVSTDPAAQLKRLKEKQLLTPDGERFEAGLNVEETGDWNALKTVLGAERDAAFDWLRRSDFKTLPEDDLQDLTRAMLSLWLSEEPDAAYARLRDWIEQDATLNRRLSRDDLIKALGPDGAIKQYQLDQAMPGRLATANRSYTGSYRKIGAGLFDIEPPEVEQLVKAILDPDGPRIVALSGGPGSGKSVIVRKALEAIEPSGIARLAFRVDQLDPVTSLKGLGEAVIETAESPAVVLESMAGTRPAMLVVDQADAVSEMSGRSANMRRLVLKLVEQARHFPHLRLVFSCRAFDLDNDHQFREIIQRPGALRIEVADLGWDQVTEVLSRLGIAIDASNPRTTKLLSSPIGLALAAELSTVGVSDLTRVDSISQLYEKLLDARDRELRAHSVPWALMPVMQAIAEAMSERQDLVAPAMLLDPFPGAADHLQRLGLIVVRDGRISLLHESLFDFLHARAFVARGEELSVFLLREEQTLFRRTQVRQILALERELDRSRYLRDLAVVLTDPRVRAHVRDVVIRWLATIAEPSEEEWALVAGLAAKNDGLPRETGHVIFGKPSWFRLLDRISILAEWLKSTDENGDLKWVLGFLRTVADQEPQAVAALLNSLMDMQPDAVPLVLEQFLYFEPKGPSPELADALVRAIAWSRSVTLDRTESPLSLIAAGWVKDAPDDAARLIAAAFDRWHQLKAEGSPLAEEVNHGSEPLHHIAEFAKLHPGAMLQAVLPAMRVAMERLPCNDEAPKEDQLWHWRRVDRDDVKLVELIDEVRNALATVAKDDPKEAARLLALLDPRQHMTALHLLLETAAVNPEPLAYLLAAEVRNPGLFLAGWSGAPASSAGKAFGAAWPFLDDAVRHAFDERLQRLWPEHHHALENYRESRAPRDEQHFTPDRLRLFARHYLERSGMTLWSCAHFLDRSALSPPLKEQLRVLDRKFAGCRPQAPDGISGGVMRSPIAPDRAQRMNDDAWLTAMLRLSETSEERHVYRGLIGGPRELSHLLASFAKDNPERFLGLICRIPEGVHGCFAEALVRGFAEAKPEAEFIERVLEAIAANPSARPDDRSLVWLVRSCKEPGPAGIELLLEIAKSADSSSGVGMREEAGGRETVLHRQAFARGDHLLSQYINSARGSALEQLGSFAWRDKKRFEAFTGVAESICMAPVPPHIHAAMSLFLLAALKHEPETGLKWLEAVAARNPDALFPANGRRALLWADTLDHNRLAAIIETYLAGSPVESVFGAWIVFVRSLADARWDKRAEELLGLSRDHRAAAAAVASSFARNSEDTKLCLPWLIRFIDDDDSLVRKEATDVFRGLNPLDLGRALPFYEAYVRSPYFSAEPGFFLHNIERAPPDIDAIILDLVEQAVERLRAAQANELHRTYGLWEPIFRIYASHPDDTNMRRRCLDVIDALVTMGAMGIDKLNAT